MMKIITLSILFIYSNLIFSQELVQNWDFEDLNNEPCGLTTSAFNFDNAMLFWVVANTGTPDIFLTTIDSACWNFQTNSTYPGPIGLKGNQEPHSGNAFVGIFAYTIDGFNQRDYIQVQLSSIMETGAEYIVEFYVSLADSTEFSVDNLGAYLSVNPVFASDDGPLNNDPQVEFTGFVDDTENWVRIADTIVADEDYNYITIGNFNNDTNTATQANPVAGTCVGCYGAYYFIDDVSVTEYLVTDIQEINIDASISTYPNPFQSSLTIQSEIELRDVNITIHDASGKIVFTKFLENGDEFQLALDELQKGVYFMNVSHSRGMKTLRLIKIEN
jgi:hypothetical protein